MAARFSNSSSYWQSRLDESGKAREYESVKREWVRKHPDASPEEYERFIKWLAGWLRF